MIEVNSDPGPITTTSASRIACTARLFAGASEGSEPHAGKGAHAVRDPRLAMNDVALTRLAGQTHELERGGMDVPDAAQQALAGVDGLDEGARLLGKRHEQEVSERMVVDVGKAMGKGAGDGRRRVLGEGGEALAHVPGGTTCSCSRSRPVEPPSSAIATTESICAPIRRSAAMSRGCPVPPPMETAFSRRVDIC